MTEEKQDNRMLPSNDLDLNLLLTDSLWGRNEVSQELLDKLKEVSPKLDEEGNHILDKNSLWGLLGFYTRDMRLGNLSTFDNELQVCRYYLDLSNDLLAADMVKPFLISLSRVATILETSQSKGGFLRRMNNTLRQEHINENREPQKKGFFGGGKKQEGFN